MTVGKKLKAIRDKSREEIDNKLNDIIAKVFPILKGAAETGADCCEIKNAKLFADWKKLIDDDEFAVHNWCDENDLDIVIDYEQEMLVFSWEEK